MDNIIEQLRKEARPIVPQCLGKEIDSNKHGQLDKMNSICSRIDPVELFNVAGDGPESELPNVDESCRCTAYAFPSAKWKNSCCPLATHVHYEDRNVVSKTRIGQQKHKKK